MVRSLLVVRLAAVTVVAALALPPVAMAAPGKLTPEKAETLRDAARAKAFESGDPTVRADVLYRSGQALSDPVLMLEGAENLRAQADAERSSEMAAQALVIVATAIDVVHFMLDEKQYGRTRWHPLDAAELPEVRDRAYMAREMLQSLIETIEAERAAAEAARLAALQKPPPEEKQEMKPGTGLVIGGAVSVALIGGGGLGLMGFGLARGNSIQSQVEALSLPTQMTEYERLDDEGKTANVFSIVGGVVGAVGLGVGIGMISAGIKKRRAGGDAEEEDSPEVALVPAPNGAFLVGRF